MFEVLIAGALILSGAVTLLLWADARVALEMRSFAALLCLIVGTSSGLVVALRLTGLHFSMGAIPAAMAALAGWALAIAVIARPPSPATARDES